MNRLVPLFLSLACAATIQTGHADQATLQRNLDAFSTTMPNFKPKILGETPIKGLFELQLGDQLVYSDDSARYFLMGDLYDFKTKTNLTAQTTQRINQIDVTALPLQQAIKTVRGNGQRVLYVFSDPDCPYCKQLEKNLLPIDNVTIYTFVYPLKSLHPNAETRARQIWCSADRSAAWQAYMNNGSLPATAATSCADPIKQNLALGQRLNIGGTPTLFLKDGHRLTGAISTADLERVLQ